MTPQMNKTHPVNSTPNSQQSGLRHLPRTVWMLGLVSFFMDFSSEMIHGLLPVFMVAELGASATLVGLVEGIAEATASITKVFSGIVSDWVRRRKFLTALGYGMAALTKPLFPMATSLSAVLTARFLDRIGKGIRGAPRDALIADVVTPDQRGAAYGLRQGLDTAGAFAGPLAAIGLMFLFQNNLRAVFAVAVIPALLAVVLVIWGVKEPDNPHATGTRRPPIQWSQLRRFPREFWLILLITGVFTMARFSEAFLVLRVQQLGLPLPWIPAVLMVMSLVYAASSYPLGRLSDRLGRLAVLKWGVVTLIFANIFLMTAANAWMAMAGIAIWGLHMGMTQGVLSAMVADHAPEDLRGTAFGLFNLTAGIILLLASSLAGVLWDWRGAPVVFGAGIIYAIVTLVLLQGRRALRP